MTQAAPPKPLDPQVEVLQALCHGFGSSDDLDDGTALAVLPLVCRNEALGVLEVVAPRPMVAERAGTLAAVASQMAGAIRNIKDRRRLQLEVQALGSATDQLRGLMRADTLESATREAMNLSYRVLHAPVAAWVRIGGEPRLHFLGVRGMGIRRRKALEGALPSVRSWESCGPGQRAQLLARFREVLEVAKVAVIDGGDAMILVSGELDSANPALDAVRSLFEEALRHLSTVARAARRNEQLDLGIAWTAHEVREPLLAVKAALDQLSGSNGSLAHEEVLSRSGQELGELAALVDALLRWAVGGTPLRRRTVDLVQVVRQAVESCRLESGERRLEMEADAPVLVSADPKHLRSAVSNVLRNALAYS